MINSSPDSVYFDVLVTNNIQGNSQPISAYYNTSRTMPLITDTTDYMLSIIRFTLDTQSLPIFQPQIQSNQSNINLTTYSISMAYTDPSGTTIVVQQYLEYEPQDATNTIPSEPVNNAPYYIQDKSIGYYNVYSYQYLVYLVNNTFQSCLQSLQTSATNAGVVLPIDSTTQTLLQPIMTFDTVAQTCNINISDDCYCSNSGIKIYFNVALFALFSSFPFVKSIHESNGRNFELTNKMGSNLKQIQQEYSTVANWCPVMSIVFTTSLIPVISNQVGLPAVYNDGKLVSASSNASSFNIITDLVADNFQFSPFIIYSPSVFRYISLLPNQKLSHLDIQVYWQDRLGNLNPVMLPNNSSMTVKLLFSKLQSEN